MFSTIFKGVWFHSSILNHLGYAEEVQFNYEKHIEGLAGDNCQDRHWKSAEVSKTYRLSSEGHGLY